MNAQTVQVEDLQLVTLPTAVNCADLFVQFMLGEWSLRPLIEDASEAACQLVMATVESADSDFLGFITLRLSVRGDNLVIEVQDEQPLRSPAVPPPLTGLRTGVVPFDDRGKVVWCELPLPGGMTATAVPLPRRERRPSPAAERERLANQPLGPDPEVMERILFGLGTTPPNQQAQ